MSLIRIQECPERPDGSNAQVSFEHGIEYSITISDPFTEEEESLLEWYFEQHLSSPFVNQIKAKRGAESISTYGETLFKQVFGDPDAYNTYTECVNAGLSTVQIEVAGSPAFHRLHWEALKDPQFQLPLAIAATIIRTTLKSQSADWILPSSPTMNILVVTARPWGRRDIGYRTISRPLIESVEQVGLPVRIDLLRPGTYNALESHLEISERLGVTYHVVHFDVHGAMLTWSEVNRVPNQDRHGRSAVMQYEDVKAFLFLDGEFENTVDPVGAEELSTLIVSHKVPIVILNACQSGKQIGASETSLGSLLMQVGTPQVLAMGYSVTVSAAGLMMRTLYTQLVANRELAKAVTSARLELYSRKGRRAYFNQTIDLEDWLLPVVYQVQSDHLPVFTSSSIEAEILPKQNKHYSPPHPLYEFVGRDLDILQIEKRLLGKRNLVLISGMGGMGKTTLLHHLGGWWQITGFVEQVWYFGYDERAWTRQHILTRIAQDLLTPEQYIRVFIPLSVDAQQIMITKQLHLERHLLILDNLESITGTQLVIQHPLPHDEKTALRDLLVDLVDGRTLVLFGSQEKEEWLAKETFADNVYELSGLDTEAASTLTDLILKRHDVEKYRQDNDLLKLLKLIDGHPLALEVVLANLAHQTPAEVLSALQTGETTLDASDSQKRTESILHCIDYSFGNLSKASQQLLVCFAPFTSVIYQRGLDQYIDLLRLEPALAQLPFESWSQMRNEIMDRGLLSIRPEFPSFLRLNPILPYFLRTRLNNLEQSNIRRAIEMAFYRYYKQISHELDLLQKSKDPQKQRTSQMIMQIEYENLSTALDLALVFQEAVEPIFNVLISYQSVVTHDQTSLKLSEAILSRLGSYTSQRRDWEFDRDTVSVTLTSAVQKFELGQYAEAEELYKEVLNTTSQMDDINLNSREHMKAMAFNLLGQTAQEQRQWSKARQYYQQGLQILTDLNDDARAEICYSLGRLAAELAEWNEAKQYYQQALQIFIDSNDRRSQADAYCQLGILATDQGQWSLAMQYFLKDLDIIIDFNDQYALSKTYLNLGNVAIGQDQWDLAVQYYLNALHIFIDLNDHSEQANIYFNLGGVEAKREQWDQAEEYYLKALRILNILNDRYKQAQAYRHLGLVNKEQEQWDQAKEYYLKALQIFLDLGDRAEQGQIYHSLGDVSQEQEQWVQAEEYYLKALPIFIDLNDRLEQAGLYTLLGTAMVLGNAVEEQRLQEAEQCYLKAVSIYMDFNDRSTAARVYDQLGNLGMAQGLWTKSEQYYLQALPLYIDLDERPEQAKTYLNLGLLAQEQDRWSHAEQYYLKALPLFIETDNRSEQSRIYLRLGTIAEREQRWSQAEQSFQKALQIFIDLKDRHSQGRTYRRLGAVAYNQEQWIQAQQYYQRALQIFIDLKDDRLVAQTYLDLAKIHSEQEQWAQAEQYFREALPIFVDLNDRAEQGRSYNLLGNTLVHQQRWQEGEHSYQQALEIFIELNDEILVAQTYTQLGHLAEEQSEWTMAEQYYLKALPFLTHANERSQQAGIYSSLGDIARKMHRWEQAEQHFLKALQIFIDLDDRHLQGSIYHELGRVAQDCGKLELAVKYYQPALQIFIEVADEESLAGTYLNLGMVTMELGQLVEAEQYCRQSLQISIDHNDRRRQGVSYLELGNVFLGLGKLSQAEEYYQQSLQIKKDLNDRYAPALTFLMLGNLAQSQNRWAEAQQYYQQALEIFISFNDPYGQAKSCHALGTVASEDHQWIKAETYFLRALKILVAYENTHFTSVTLYSLADLWKTTGHEALLSSVASIMDTTPSDVRTLFEKMHRGKTNDQDN